MIEIAVNKDIVGAAVAAVLLLLSALFALVSWLRVRQPGRKASAYERFMSRAAALVWISWSNLVLQGFVVTAGLTIATDKNFVGVSVMIGFLVAILAVGYRYALRTTFFYYSRADALLIMEKRVNHGEKDSFVDGVPLDDEKFGKLARMLSPDEKPEGDPPPEPVVAAIKAALEPFRKS